MRVIEEGSVGKGLILPRVGGVVLSAVICFRPVQDVKALLPM